MPPLLLVILLLALDAPPTSATPPPPSTACVTSPPLDFCSVLSYPLTPLHASKVSELEKIAKSFYDQTLSARRQKLGILHEDKLEFCDDLLLSAICSAVLPMCEEELEKAGERHRKPCKLIEAAIRHGCDWEMGIGDLTFAEAPDCFLPPPRAYSAKQKKGGEGGEEEEEEEEEEDEDVSLEEDLRSIGDVLRAAGEREIAHYAYLHVLKALPNDRVVLSKLHALMHSSEQEARAISSFNRIVTDTSDEKTVECMAKIQAFDGRSEADAINEERKASIIVQIGEQFGLKTFVETGTWYGTTLALVNKYFSELHSVEISQQLYEAARQRFAPLSHVHLHNGDSGKLLPELVQKLDPSVPVLFWLDSHFSGSRYETSRGEIDTSLLPELNAVLTAANPNHVILIDDARMFRGFDVCRGNFEVECYPKIELIQELVCRRQPTWTFEVVEDVIRIYNPRRTASPLPSSSDSSSSSPASSGSSSTFKAPTPKKKAKKNSEL